MTEGARFSSDFLCRVVDTMLPGLPATGVKSALPSASELGLHEQLRGHLAAHPDATRFANVLLAITDEAGGMVRFVESDELSATATLEAVETTMSTGFAAFLFVIAADYYESEDVLRAFGWRVTPPQPLGYELAPFDETLLAPVKSREQRLWRSVETAE